MSNEMDSEEQDNILDHQQQDASFFTDLATAISGATQSANQEFGRFWEKYVSNKGNTSLSQNSANNNTLLKYKSLQPSQNDISRMRARKNIQGRIIPDNNRGGYMKDAEIQTDKLMAEAIPDSPQSQMEDDIPRYPLKRRFTVNELDEVLPRPPKMARVDLTPPAKPFSASTYSQTPKFSLQPIKSSSYNLPQTSFISVEDLDPNDDGTPKPLNKSPSVIRPIRSPSIRRSAGSPSYLTPVKASPERLCNKSGIVTGSSKSVRRLTFELEEAFSPRFPASYSPVSSPIKKGTIDTTEINDEDPFHSKPLVKDAPKPGKRLTEEEEDERVQKLEKKAINIKSQAKYVSYPSIIKSPTPSHTVANTAIKETSFKTISSPIRKSTPSSTTTSPLDRFGSSPLVLPLSPIRLASSSTSLPSTVNGFSPVSRIPVPPPLPPIANQFSPVRDIPLGFHALPFRNTFSPIRDTSLPLKDTASPIRNISLPLKNTTSPIRNTSLLSTPSHDDKKPSPAEKHKLKMRKLIQSIPFYQLRKADVIIGADGVERPNPFWNEIYGRRRLE